MIILLMILIYPVIIGVTLVILNDKCLLPGTTNYKCRQMERRDALEVQRSRSAAIRARYLASENEAMDRRIHQITT